MHDASASDWLVIAFLVFFVGMWLLILNVLAAIGGWRSLAASYAFDAPIEGESFSLRSANIGPVNYGSCLRFTASRSGLVMSILFPFRPGHRPLFIPWEDVAATSHRGWVFQYVDLRFSKQPQVRVRISRRLAERVVASSGRAVRVSGTA